MESEPDFPSFPFSCIAFILCGELALLRFRVRAPFWSWGPRWEYKGGIGGISSGVIPPTPPTMTGSSLCGSSIWIRFSPPRKCAAAAAAATEKSARRVRAAAEAEPPRSPSGSGNAFRYLMHCKFTHSMHYPLMKFSGKPWISITEQYGNSHPHSHPRELL